MLVVLQASRWLQAVSRERKGLRDVLLSRIRLGEGNGSLTADGEGSLIRDGERGVTCDGDGGPICGEDGGLKCDDDRSFLLPRSAGEHDGAQLETREATSGHSGESRDATEKRTTPGEFPISSSGYPVSLPPSPPPFRRSSSFFRDWQRRELLLLLVFLSTGKLSRGGAPEKRVDSVHPVSRRNSSHRSSATKRLLGLPSLHSGFSTEVCSSPSLRGKLEDPPNSQPVKKARGSVKETVPTRNWVYDWCTHIGFQELQLRLFTYAVARKGASNG